MVQNCPKFYDVINGRPYGVSKNENQRWLFADRISGTVSKNLSRILKFLVGILGIIKSGSRYAVYKSVTSSVSRAYRLSTLIGLAYLFFELSDNARKGLVY